MKKTRDSESLLAAKYTAEAIRLGGGISRNQLRFFEAAKKHRALLEQAGPMAGYRL